MNTRTLRLGVPIALLWFGVDQGTKAWALHHFSAAPRDVVVTPFFNLVLMHNTGVTFGMFSDTPRWMLVSAMVAISAIVVAWMWRAETRGSAIALALVCGGALGNIADRIRHGAVTDFLDFHAGQWHWPAFNAADVGIVCGVALLLVDERARPKRAPESGSKR